MNTSEMDRPITVTTRRVFCDGGGALGHPGVYLNMEASGRVVCPYCSRTFVLDPKAPAESGH